MVSGTCMDCTHETGIFVILTLEGVCKAAAFPHVRRGSQQLRIKLTFGCIQTQLPLREDLLSFSHILPLYFLPSCSVVFTQGSLNTVVGSVSAPCSYRNAIWCSCAHFRVKCWSVFQRCPPGHLVIHLTSCFLFVFLPVSSVDSPSSLLHPEGMHITFQRLPRNLSL